LVDGRGAGSGDPEACRISESLEAGIKPPIIIQNDVSNFRQKTVASYNHCCGGADVQTLDDGNHLMFCRRAA
jgi:hypothetical protein